MGIVDLLSKFKPIDVKTAKTDRSGNVIIEGDVNVVISPTDDMKDEYMRMIGEIRQANITEAMQEQIRQEVAKQLLPLKSILSGVSTSAQQEVLGSTLVNSTYDVIKK